MMVDRRHKYIHYTHEQPQVFDLGQDPDELNDLTKSAEHQKLVQSLENRFRAELDPEAIDDRRKQDQLDKVEAFGGMDAVLNRGLSNSPVPGEKPAFAHFRK